jgi:hypothetical protein
MEKPLTPIQQLDEALTILAEKEHGLYKQFGVISTRMTGTSMPDVIDFE